MSNVPAVTAPRKSQNTDLISTPSAAAHTEQREVRDDNVIPIHQAIASGRREARVRALVYGHLDAVLSASESDEDRKGVAMARRLLAAIRGAVRRKKLDIRGSAPEILAALAKDWVGPLPVDGSCKALRAALHRLERFSPMVQSYARGRWEICLSVARSWSPDSRGCRLLVLKPGILPRSAFCGRTSDGDGNGILPRCASAASDNEDRCRASAYNERARATGGVGWFSRSEWLDGTKRVGRVWGEVTASMLEAAGEMTGTAHEVACALLTTWRGPLLPSKPRKWARRAYTQRERQGVTGALVRLEERGLIVREGNCWRVPSFGPSLAEIRKNRRSEQDAAEARAVLDLPSGPMIRVRSTCPPPRDGHSEAVKDAVRSAVRLKKGRWSMADLDALEAAVRDYEREACLGEVAISDAGPMWQTTRRRLERQAGSLIQYLAASLRGMTERALAERKVEGWA